METDSIRSRLAEQLDPHGSTGAKTALSGVIDLEALDEERYEDVLRTIDNRLSQARYSLISMLIAGIYFGVLVGYWLVAFGSWSALLTWGLPVVLVSTYGLFAAHQTARQIRHLSEARSLLTLLLNARTDGTAGRDD